MAGTSGRDDRRTDALSRERIVQEAIALLDAAGESGLTFRALTTRLGTGAGAVYWHVANKGELLAAATEDVVARAIHTAGKDATPAGTIRAVALGLFDAIDEHPWVGAHLSQAALLEIFERVGAQLQALRVPEHAQFFAVSTLVNYVLGVASQNASNARHAPQDGDRATHLATFAARWASLDATRYPFARRMAGPLRDHDDREQFLAGIDLILAGVATLR